MNCARTKKIHHNEIRIDRRRRDEYVAFRSDSVKNVEKSFWHEPQKSNKLFIVGKPQESDLEISFKAKVNIWRAETDGLSAMEDVISHPAYLKIIGMGERVIPLILKELRDKGGRWNVALASISDSNPVREEHLGFSKKIREAWLEWGQKNHYL